MTTGSMVVRIILGAIGAVMLLAGIGVAVLVPVGGFIGAVWLIISGVVLLVAVLIETTRYRSQAAELAKLPPGPGGGETGPVDGRFRATDEVFVDPTSNQRMRVYLDASTGERRYVAEG
jgi:hypothetical protein